VRGLGRDHAVFEGGERDERLQRGSRRVCAAQCTVIERHVDVVRERAVLGDGQPARKTVRVERRRTDEREHVAVRRVDRHDRGALSAQRLLGNLLQPPVEREQQVVARDRLLAHEFRRLDPDAVDASSLRVDEQLLVAGRAVQRVLVHAFDAELADQRGAGVGRHVDAFLVLLADRAHVAECVHADPAERVVAREPRPDLDAREVGPVHGEAREFLFRELEPDRDGLERAPCEDRAPGALEFLGREQLQLHEAAERVVEVRGLLARELELVGRAIERERLAVAVENQPARRWQRVDLDPVALRELGEVVVAHDLQPEQPREQRAEQQEHDQRRRHHAAPEHALFGVVVLEAGVAGHRARALRPTGASGSRPPPRPAATAARRRARAASASSPCSRGP
jgi:hypothetical protein